MRKLLIALMILMPLASTSLAQEVVIKLTPQEAKALYELMDAGLKQKGMDAAVAAALIGQKLKKAQQESQVAAKPQPQEAAPTEPKAQ